MPKNNPENERVKRTYLRYLREARGRSEQTLDKVAAAVNRFEQSTQYKTFKRLRIDDIESFKRVLAEDFNRRTGQPLSKSTVLHILQALRNFFQWLAREPGYRSMRVSDADYFNLSTKDARIAQATQDRRVPTVDQIVHVLACMPSNTHLERRDRALVAFTLLTGARDGAIASFKLRHINVVEWKVIQDAREVNTKFAKSFTTWFFPVPDEVARIVTEWVQFLIKIKLFGPDDPLFPATQVDLVDQRFAAVGLSRTHWKNATPIRKVFKAAFERAGLPYSNPHSFRSTLGLLGQQRCRTPEEFKVWSQNLGHESPLTTLTSYGKVEPARQAQLIRELARRRVEASSNTISVSDLMRFVRTQSRHGPALAQETEAVGQRAPLSEFA